MVWKRRPREAALAAVHWNTHTHTPMTTPEIGQHTNMANRTIQSPGLSNLSHTHDARTSPPMQHIPWFRQIETQAAHTVSTYMRPVKQQELDQSILQDIGNTCQRMLRRMLNIMMKMRMMHRAMGHHIRINAHEEGEEDKQDDNADARGGGGGRGRSCEARTG